MWKPRDGGLGLGHGNVKHHHSVWYDARYRYEIT